MDLDISSNILGKTVSKLGQSSLGVNPGINLGTDDNLRSAETELRIQENMDKIGDIEALKQNAIAEEERKNEELRKKLEDISGKKEEEQEQEEDEKYESAEEEGNKTQRLPETTQAADEYFSQETPTVMRPPKIKDDSWGAKKMIFAKGTRKRPIKQDDKTKKKYDKKKNESKKTESTAKMGKGKVYFTTTKYQ